MEKTIWTVVEYVLWPHGAFELNHEGFYSTKENAIAAVYKYLSGIFDEEDINTRVTMVTDGNDVTITTHCGDDYGVYDCTYNISPWELDSDLE